MFKYKIIDNPYGPVADPGPEIWSKWLSKLTVEQQKVVMVKEMEQRINLVKFQIANLEAELEKLETVKSMMR